MCGATSPNNLDADFDVVMQKGIDIEPMAGLGVLLPGGSVIPFFHLVREDFFEFEMLRTFIDFTHDCALPTDGSQ